MRQIDTVLDEIRPVLAEVLGEVGPGGTGSGSERWLLVKRKDGLTIADASMAEPHDLLAKEIDSGADAAVVVSLNHDYSEDVLAQVLAADPRDSDIRRSHVTRLDDGTVTLSAWEYTV